MEADQSSLISWNQFAHYVEVASELLGDADPATQVLRTALVSGDSHAIGRGMAVIRALPSAQRSHILALGKRRANEDSDLQEWLMQNVGTPTNIPPDRNVH